MASYYRINDRQKELLQRIEVGRQPVTSREAALAVSVYALRSRGLVRTPRHAGVWTAEITDAGRYYLQHGRHPKEDRQRQPAAPGTGPAAGQAKREHPAPAIEPQELIRRVTEAGGTLRIDDPDPAARSAWRSAIQRAGESVPDGYVLGHSGRLRGDLLVWLSPQAPSPAASPRPPVPVPERLTKAHPVVEVLRRDPSHLRVSKQVVPRALRLLHAVAVEAERRGYTVRLPDRRRDGTVTLTVNGHTYSVAIRELSTRTPHTPTARELAEQQRSSWVRIPEYDYTPSGELEMSLGKDYSGRTSVFADRKRWRLDDKLPDLLAEIEARAERAEARRLERIAREAQELERRREATRRAYEHLVEHTRAEALLGQVQDWRRAGEIRQFCSAVRAIHSKHPDATNDPVEEAWLAWSEAYADRLDPMHRLLGPPPQPKPSLEALQPFAGGRIVHYDELEPLLALFERGANPVG